jgi:hypothetical protein
LHSEQDWKAFQSFTTRKTKYCTLIANVQAGQTLLERIYNPITAMGFSAMFTFQLDNTKVNIARTPLP